MLTAVLGTDAGMHALWDAAAFAHVDGYAAWALELEDDADISRHIEAGHFIPINIRSDGVVCIAVRADRDEMPTLSGDESRRVVATSGAYRLRTAGQIAVSGIEFVGPVDDRVRIGQLDAGDYDVVIYLLDYEDVPEKTDQHPDFVITIGPPVTELVQTWIETFAPMR